MDFLNQITFALVFKFTFLFIVFLYIIFTFVVFNQVRSMNQIISEIHPTTVKALSLAGIFAAIMLFLVALVIL